MDDLVLLSSRRERLVLRARILEAVRGFFRAEGFLEVTTPVLTPSIIPEEHTHAVATDGGFLLPSPEIHMKRLVAAGYERIFQVGPAFRRGERGRFHLPEFTILEWYRAGADYRDLAADCEALFLHVCRVLEGSSRITYLGRTIDLASPWPRVTVREAFERLAGWNPLAEHRPGRFEEDLAEKVMPGLDPARPHFLVDFPLYEASLARRSPVAQDTVERLELVVGGMELANGFSELTDAGEQRRRFEEANRRRAARGEKAYPMPERFLAALSKLPPCAGIALGMDRLVMLFTGAERIDQVVALTPEDG